MICDVCGVRCECETPAPVSVAALLGPGIRYRLRQRYSSVTWVNVVDDPRMDQLIVSYALTTGESNSIAVPLAWWRDNQYGRILSHVEKDLHG